MVAKPVDAKKRRERSKFSEADAFECMRWYSQKVIRFSETSAPGSFTHPNRDKPAMGHGYINVQLMFPGSFGAADDFFEAIRVLAGYKLPRKD